MLSVPRVGGSLRQCQHISRSVCIANVELPVKFTSKAFSAVNIGGQHASQISPAIPYIKNCCTPSQQTDVLITSEDKGLP